ncbi:phytanoyl-CoA dioxygenase family protein [uncultured Shimia sp.]|uniref:phytanoyl-CoA dioxygenase family protein n=1 Tax=uncultured Shimia sp. TaxID=573152 RepID=UPI00262E204F|nr:phytanoyl-CoA dioxygenase family protein [uncultured Shimia sp.]
MAHTYDLTGFYDPQKCDVRDFETCLEQVTRPENVPLAMAIEKNIPVYDGGKLQAALEGESRRSVMAEWARVLRSGAGIVVLKGAYRDTRVLDEATEIYERIIEQEKQNSGGGADHFAASGANDRIWNSLQKLCEAVPVVFMRYFANPAIAAVCEAWLGPNYQMTAQVNLVHPGGAAQQAHRDYHLGFQTADVSAAYPAHVHEVSPVLTLQGGVAHCDMPLESGPTKLLPFSQTYKPGYAAWRREDFRAVFEERCVQLPLSKGDAVFFNPALFHAAGANSSADIHRFVNLLQVSSAFGRAMETVDREKMCRLVFPHAVRASSEGTLTQTELSAAIAATAEGYSFPTNLDRDPPSNGLAPETQAAFFQRAIEEGLSVEQFCARLTQMKALKLAP